MKIKNRKISKRFGFSHISPEHPDFIDQLEDNIAESVLTLLSKGYSTTASCHGHTGTPYIYLEEDYDIKKYFKYNLFVICDGKVIETRRFIFLSNVFLCRQIENVVKKLPKRENKYKEFFDEDN